MAGVLACAVAFVFGFVGSVPLAGPIAIMILSRGAVGQFREARRLGLGAAAAEAIYAGIAFWGFATFLGHRRLILPISHGATAVVLTAVGVRFLFWRARDGHDPPRRAPGRPGSGAPRRPARARTASPADPTDHGGTVLTGFSVSALNPTLLLTWSAAVALLHSKGLGGAPPGVAVPFGACAGAGVAAWIVCLVALLRRYEGKLPPRALTGVVRGMGLALVGLGLWSGVQLVQWLRAPPRTASGASAAPARPSAG